MENKEKIIVSVKDIKRGRMYAVPDPINEDDISEDERELLNSLVDPHSWGPGYGED